MLIHAKWRHISENTANIGKFFYRHLEEVCVAYETEIGQYARLSKDDKTAIGVGAGVGALVILLIAYTLETTQTL